MPGRWLRLSRAGPYTRRVFGSTPNAKLRGGIELAIRVAAPVLDLMLFVGDGVSRVLHPGDRGYSLARVPHEGDSAPQGLETRTPHAPRSPTQPH